MKPRCHVLLFLAGLLLLPSLLRAQESDIEAPPLTIREFRKPGICQLRVPVHRHQGL